MRQKVERKTTKTVTERCHQKPSSSLKKREVAESPTPKYFQKFVRVDQRPGKGLQSQDFREPGVLDHTLDAYAAQQLLGGPKQRDHVLFQASVNYTVSSGLTRATY